MKTIGFGGTQHFQTHPYNFISFHPTRSRTWVTRKKKPIFRHTDEDMLPGSARYLQRKGETPNERMFTKHILVQFMMYTVYVPN